MADDPPLATAREGKPGLFIAKPKRIERHNYQPGNRKPY